MHTTLLPFFSLLAVLGVLANPTFSILGSVYTIGGRSPFRPLDGHSSAELEQEAARRVLRLSRPADRIHLWDHCGRRRVCERRC
jgi:hypothetical protein